MTDDIDDAEPPRDASVGRVSIAMYPFPHLHDAYQRLWDAVVARVDGLTPNLTWADDVAGLWRDPEMVIAQTCGWPLVTTMADTMQVVGAFAYDVPGAVGARYRSVIVATRPAPLTDFAGATVAVNNPDSLSGWVSLRNAFGDYGEVVWSGAHRQSVRALAEGRAEVASIDAVSYAHIAHAEPDLVAGLHVVGRGPLVPSLPLITRRDLAPSDIGGLRTALRAATADRRLAATLATLRIVGFQPFSLADYTSLATLDPELFAEQTSHTSHTSQPST